MTRLWEKILFCWLLAGTVTIIIFPEYRDVITGASVYPLMVLFWMFMVGILAGLFPYFVVCSALKVRVTTFGACASVAISGVGAFILVLVLG